MSEPASGPGDSDSTHPDADSTHHSGATGAVAKTVGPYRLLQKIGEGGMGEVWMAEQSTPIRRQVAVKIIKAGMDTRMVIARFEAERQALAMMDHPAIAKVFDGGATVEGRPYFAMEWVKGNPITGYCDRHRLSTTERLELFIQVCEGVQHAHQKGLIHRDLKPSNILVTLADGRAVPKVIDFGLAKAMTQPLTDRTLFTELGVMIGTPEYMSPEQAELTGLDIDTRTDIYALGVVLYELLTGTLPFDRQSLRQRGVDEIRRVIREMDPPKPSSRLIGLGHDSAEAASRRQTEVRQLMSQLRGDLDWITMKALEKDRTRRYDTAIDLAADVRRHLRDEPVLAGPPSTLYRATKFVRRHRVGVSAAAAIFLLVVGFAVAMAGQARRVTRERDRATQESTRANREAEAARQVSDFFLRLFELADPSEARGGSVTAREILETGSARIEQDLGEQPVLQSRVMTTIGDAYQKLGLFKNADALFRKSLDVRTKAGVAQDVVAEGLFKLGHLQVKSGNFSEAAANLGKALAIQESTPGVSPVAVAETIGAIGELAYSQGEYPKAESHFERRLDMLRKQSPNSEREIADSLTELAMAVQQTRSDYARAKALNEEALAIRRRIFAPPHVAISESLNNLAMVYYRSKDYTAAEPLFKDSLAMNRLLFGDVHPEVSANLSNLGLVARDRGDYRQADALLGQAVAMDRTLYGSRHIQVARLLNNWGETVRRSGDPRRAETLLRESWAIHKEVLSPTHWQAVATEMLVVRSLIDQRKFPDAERLLNEAFPLIEREFGPTHARTLAAVERAVELYTAWNKPAQVEAWRAKPKRPPT
jgi:non-specific serine/threonine protein kinase/serine/threonine-protein kinase